MSTAKILGLTTDKMCRTYTFFCVDFLHNFKLLLTAKFGENTKKESQRPKEHSEIKIKLTKYFKVLLFKNRKKNQVVAREKMVELRL